MLQWMHRLSQSWVASLLMGALALSFVVWGIADVFTGIRSDALATVGSTEIGADAYRRSYRNFVRNEGQQMGMDISDDMARRMGLPNIALQQLISRTAMDNAIHRMGLVTSDAALAQNVRSMPVFKGATGQFDHATFLQIVGNAGYTEQSFLDEIRSDMTRQQLTNAIEGGFLMPAGYAQAIFQYLTERRAADYVVVTPEAAGAVAPPSDAVLAAYVKAHADRFSTPEYRQIEYAEIGPEDLAGQMKVTDQMVAQDYDAHKSLYQVPEKRDIQQIEFANEAEAKAARAELDKGKSFEALAAEHGIKPADLSLGSLSRDELGDAARADAAFSLAANQVSQPVKTALGGYVLMRVTKITPGVSHPLDTVKDQIRKNLATQMAEGKIADIVNAFEDARSGGASIAEAAKKTGMKAGRIAAVDRNGLAPDGSKIADLPADPEFLTQAFSYEVGDDNDPFPAKSGEYYAIKVDGITPPKLKPLDQVRADAVAAWSDEQRHAALEKKAAELAARATIQKSLDGIAKELKVPVQHSPALSRNTNDTTFSAELTGKLFDAKPDGIVEGAAGNNFIIARVTGIAHAPTVGQQFESAREQLSQQAASDFSVSFANAARLRDGVRVNQQMLQSALGE